VAAVQLLLLRPATTMDVGPTGFALAFANASEGPFDVLTTCRDGNACNARVTTADAGGGDLSTHTVSLTTASAAAFVQLRVSRSVDSSGGAPVCTSDRVYELRVFSPGLLPDALLPVVTSATLPPSSPRLPGRAAAGAAARQLRRFGTPQPRSPLPAAAAASAACAAAFGAVTLLFMVVASTTLWRRRRQRASCAARAGQQPRAATDDGVALLAAAADGAFSEHAAPQQAQKQPDEPAFDVFLSYDQGDWRLADALYDKLRLCGLHVCKSAARDEAPFDAARLRALRTAPVFAPVLTLQTLQRMAHAAGADAAPDTALAECLAALYFRDAAEAESAARRRHSSDEHHRRRAATRLIHPLLLGPEVQSAAEPSDTSMLRWSSLPHEPGYAAALAALPAAASGATAAAVDAALRAATGASLPPAFAAMSVRDIMLGRAAAASGEAEAAAASGGGILRGNPCGAPLFVLACAHQHLGLHIAGRYAPPILQALARAGGAGRAAASDGATRSCSR
jgi:hypothetical protein